MNGATKYKNTTRTITGAINFVSQTDVVLLCDTSLSIVDLTLLEIPQGNFSTQYKLYVVDKSNNASANNITIKAPTGFTVNNSATAVINVNGGVAVITISSNKTYNVAYNYTISGGGGNPLIIKNEGTQITPSATSIDFVGAPVTATAVGNDVTVTVTDNGGHPIAIENEGTQITPDVAKINFTGSIVNATAVGNDVTVDITLGFISVSYVALAILIRTNALIPSQQYLITDAIFINLYPYDLTDFKENVAIVVTAVTTNEISLSGSGIFLNADYQNVGDYSGVSGFVAQKGVFDFSASYIIGDVVIWDNVHWVNITGLNIGQPSLGNINWTFLTKTSTNGYITEIDTVKYNVATNQIIYREDVRNNRIENNIATYQENENLETFYAWQWGNNKVYENTILSQSWFSIRNQTGNIFSNLLDNYSVIPLSAEIQKGTISFNVLRQGTYLDLVQPLSEAIFSKNTFESCNPAVIENKGLFERNIFISNELVRFSNNTGQVTNNIVEQNSTVDISNNEGLFVNNTVSNYGRLQVRGIGSPINVGTIGYNQVIGGEMNLYINSGEIQSNNVQSGSLLKIISNLSGIAFNVLSNQSRIIVDNVLGNASLTYNILTNSGRLEITNAVTPRDCDGEIQNNFISNSNVLLKGGVDTATTFINNKIESGSRIEISEKMIGFMEQNQLSDGSVFVIENFADITANFYSNYLNSSSVTCDFINKAFKFNNFNDCNWSPITYTGKIFSYNTWTSVDFRPLDMTSDLLNTEINTATVTCPTFNINIDGGIVQDGINTISRKLDLSDPAIWDNVKGMITIPACSSTFFGYYELQNCNTLVVKAILNSSNRFPTRFRVNDTATYCDFQVQSGVASAGTHEFVYDVTGGYPISLRLLNDFGVQDYIVILRSYGDLNCIETYKHYI